MKRAKDKSRHSTKQAHRHLLSRRHMLGAMGIGTGMFLGQQLLPSRLAHAQQNDDTLFISCYFSGGFDTLLCLDPRSELEFGAGDKGIHTAYAQLAANDAGVAAALQNDASGMITPNGSNISFGPTMGKLSALYEDLCIVRGMSMGTLTHEVGRRYFLTGKFPRGLQANGSSFGTWVAHNSALDKQLPNLVVGNETYNEGLDPTASGVVVQSSEDLFYLMNSIEPSLAAGTTGAINGYLDKERCLEKQLDSTHLVSTFKANRDAAQKLASGELWQHFAFSEPNPNAEIAALLDHFDVANAEQGALFAIEQAATAAQALKYGVSQAVSIRLANGIDHHDDTYQTNHASALRHGFDAAERLIAFLKDPANGSDGKTLWDRTVLVLWSEFARTPRINSRDGRDHHLASACLVAGKGIKGNQVIGATTDNNYGAQPIDLATGDVNLSGHQVVPADVHATMLEAMGLPYDHISNQSPKIIDAMLK